MPCPGTDPPDSVASPVIRSTPVFGADRRGVSRERSCSVAGTPEFDGDGVTDVTDVCPDVPKGTDANGDGCPDRPAVLPDVDASGVSNDGRDECPTAKATVD